MGMQTRRIIAAAALALSLSMTGFGQRGEGRKGGQMARQQMEELREKLKLTEAQEKDLRAALAENMKKNMALREKAGEPGANVREERRKIVEEHDAALAKILDKDQLVKYKEIAAERREAMKKKRQ
jgi:hypothetical protein